MNIFFSAFNCCGQRRWLVSFALCLSLSGCLSVASVDSHRRLRAYQKQQKSESKSVLHVDGSLARYKALALRHSPRIRAALSAWEAELASNDADAMPDPQISYAYYVRSVETRVGPQRHRFSIAQQMPWPTVFSKNRRAALERSHSFEAKLAAVEREVMLDVGRRYWRLWALHRQHHFLSQHDLILDALSDSLRRRFENGQISFADLSEIELSRDEHHEHRESHANEMRIAESELAAVCGLRDATKIRVAHEMGVTEVLSSNHTLDAHPMFRAFRAREEGMKARAEAFAAHAMPSFRFAFDYIETGRAQTPTAGSGDDAMIAHVGMSIPIFAKGLRAKVAENRAKAKQVAAQRQEWVLLTEAAQRRAHFEREDALRRISLIQGEWMPKAEAVYRAQVASLALGDASLSDVLRAERRWLSFELSLVREQERLGMANEMLLSIQGASS